MLPKEQDKLLKELQELESKPKEEKSVAQGYIMFGLAFVATIIFIILGINDYLNNSADMLVQIFGVWACFLVSMHASYFGSKFAAVIAITISAILNMALTYFFVATQDSFQSVGLVADVFILMLVTSLFTDRGYIATVFIVLLKNIAILLIAGAEINYINMIVNTIILLVAGTALLIIMYLFRNVENSRKETIRAEILALQNQELLGGWERFLKK